MSRWMVVPLLLGVLAHPACADPLADARGVEDAFAHACGAGDVKGVMALYVDDAVAVWPGEGAEAKGKADIEKMVVGLCKERRGASIELKSLEAIPLDDTHLVAVAHWEDSMTGPRGTRVSIAIRSTEVMVKKDGAWHYLVDHASIGTPRPREAPARRTRRER